MSMEQSRRRTPGLRRENAPPAFGHPKQPRQAFADNFVHIDRTKPAAGYWLPEPAAN
jgi:hypothetical protein